MPQLLMAQSIDNNAGNARNIINLEQHYPLHKDTDISQLKGDLPYHPPMEPTFSKIKYVESNTAKLLKDRIEALVHGITIDLPPQYDRHGYELRRYMALVGGPLVLNSQHNIDGQLTNLKNAYKILDRWQDDINAEVVLINKEIDRHNSSSSIRSSLKYNSALANAFFAEARNWIDNNRAVLEYLKEIGPESYVFKAPVFKFKDRNQLKRYIALYSAQQASLEQMQTYTPFMLMVY